MYLNLFRQDIKKIFLLIAFQQSLNSGPKTADFCRYWQILVKNCCCFTAGDLKAFFLFFCFYSLPIDPSNNFCFCKFFAKGLKSEGERLKVNIFVFGNGKNWQGSAKLSPLSLPPPSSEFCNDEKNSVIRSTMDALRNSKKISLLSVAILFLFTFFNLILDAPRTVLRFSQWKRKQKQKILNLFGNIQKKAKDPIVTQSGYKGTILCPKVVATKVAGYLCKVNFFWSIPFWGGSGACSMWLYFSY